MNDKERLDILERFLYLHEFTLHPNGRTHEGWLLAKENAEIEALEFARPILLEMIRAYVEQEIAGIGCVCGHVEPDPETVTGATGMTGDQESDVHRAIREHREEAQEQEALEESCDAYHDMSDPRSGLMYAESPASQSSGQFMKHVHALRHVFFIEVRDMYVKWLSEYDENNMIRNRTEWLELKNMTPVSGMSHMIQVAEGLLAQFTTDWQAETASALEEAYVRVFETEVVHEKHD